MEKELGTDGLRPTAGAPNVPGDVALEAHRDIQTILAGAPSLSPGLLVAARWHEARAAEHDSMYKKEVNAGYSGKIEALLAHKHKMAAAHLRGLAKVAEGSRKAASVPVLDRN